MNSLKKIGQKMIDSLNPAPKPLRRKPANEERINPKKTKFYIDETIKYKL